MTEIIIKSILGLALIIFSVQDTKSKKISVWIVISGMILLAFILPFCQTVSFFDRVFGFMVGIGVMLISKITGGKIGMGDGLVLCLTGMGLGFWSNLELFAYALFAAAFVSIILLIFRLANRKKSIPFIPFLTLGYILVILSTSPVLQK